MLSTKEISLFGSCLVCNVPLCEENKWKKFLIIPKLMQVSLLNIVVELKKCCNHPFLFESADHGYGGDTNSVAKLERIILSSGKLVILDKLLNRLHETKHRVLIFSQVCNIFITIMVCDSTLFQLWGCCSLVAYLFCIMYGYLGT